MIIYILSLAGVALGVYFLSCVRYHCKTLKYDSQARMDGKTVLITGASSGIRKATAEHLLSRGARVILACRNLTKTKTAVDEILSSTGVDRQMVNIVHLDLSDLDSVRKCVKEVIDTEKQLDVLINNAGANSDKGKTTKHGHNFTFGANYIGPFLLTYLLLDLLKKSAPGRIINVSSVMHSSIKESDISFQPKNSSSSTHVEFPNWKDYAFSKLAQIWQTNVLTEKLSADNVTANSMNPGYVHSGIWYVGDCPMFRKILLQSFGWVSSKIGRSSKNAALTVVYMAVDPSLEKVSGCYFENVEISKNMSACAKNKTLAQKMWDVSMDMCGLSKKFE
ncbi:retinol dehydrogenase 14 isoform X1 [Octopus bimaculoides]|uniref:retinol dehydrogenase 14 isoform X1 n=1 Tax=Octopus bimaculoides TaxID=37653 RepID=UPI00071CEECA|nr:retinol dehydrogenase 14 isoform X1 [Octopus bimaculoides]|eukprot:XP_014783143.1 PREDICTED: retinol dehydrogenase 14-like isoform X1 [Octopus bimaculoides]